MKDGGWICSWTPEQQYQPQQIQVALSSPVAGYLDNLGAPASAWLWGYNSDLSLAWDLTLNCLRITFGSTSQGSRCSLWATVWELWASSHLFWPSMPVKSLSLEFQGNTLISTYPLTILPVVLSGIRDLTEENSTVCYVGTSPWGFVKY